MLHTSRARQCLRRFLTVLLLVSGIQSAWAWEIRNDADNTVAISPKHQLKILMLQNSKEGVCGYLYLPISAEEVEALKQYRYDKYFSFVPVIVEIDGFQRQSNAKVDETSRQVRVDIDLTTWDDIKKGKKLQINLPNGKEFKESLVGSGSALKALQRIRY